MSAQGGGNGNDKTLDTAFFILAAIAIGFASAWMLWRSNSEMILTGLFFVVGWLAKGIQYIQWLYPSSIGPNLESWAGALHQSNPADYGWPAAKLLIQTISHTICLVLVPYFIWQVIQFRSFHVVNKFVRRFNLDKLKARNASKYAAVASVQHENLLAEPLYEGPWAMARQPIDYALLNELVVVRKKRIGAQTLAMIGIESDAVDTEKPIRGWSEKKVRWSVEERRRVLPPPASCRLDVSKTDALLRAQLGGKFSEDSLDSYEKCVLAILYTANVNGLGSARKLALKLALSFKRLDAKGRQRPSIDTAGIDKIIASTKNHHIIKAIKKAHHFKTPFFMALLEASWKKGIFTAPEFLWLKPIHRGLYLALDFLGGDRPPSEALGPWAHYMLEKRVGRAIPEACIEAGTDALQQMLFDEMWIGSDDGTIAEITEKAVLDGGDDAKYSPTRGVDLYDPVRN
ncbi:hypothetical protein [Marinobacter sp. tcs-11]|uniref:secretion/conjugation apparatus DotM-related subunit n=1 Tax=Marinobacter sp. tcs-11 TaxID=1742860 RepID=UPI00257BAE12|nr:hypothetical protein [Marinobacter sp. tcs-11]